MNKIKVLLVDDHALIRDGVRALLNLEDDIEVVGEASDGKEAIEKIGELSPEIVVMDIVMPGMNGLEATRHITKRCHKTKVIILTQYDSKEYLLSAMRAGSAGFVPKSAVSSELVSTIRTAHCSDSFLCPSSLMVLIKDYREQAKSADAYNCLTSTEKEILRLTAEGLTSKEIASRLVLSLKTVMVYRSKIMEKLHLQNYTELIKFTLRKGLLRLDI